MPDHQNTGLDPRQFVVIKPLPLSSPNGTKVKARGITTYSTCEPSRERVFWENYYRRERQLSRQGYNAANWRPYEEIGERVYLEPKILILHALGQYNETPKDESLPTEKITQSTAVSENASKGSPLNLVQPRETANLATPMSQHYHTGRLGSTVRQRKGYFQHLRREKDHRWAQLRNHREREEMGSLPPCSHSDHKCLSLDTERREKLPVARPFTPVHYCLTSPQQDSGALEHTFRQLCCLNWLLEVLTVEPGGHVTSITSCWDLKDPGRSRVAMKELNKEKGIEMRWYQFISQPKTRRNARRPSHGVLWRLSLRPPAHSGASSSGTTPTAGSLSSLAPGLEETHTAGRSSCSGGSVLQESARTEHNPPVSDSLRKLLDVVYETVSKELHGQQQDNNQPVNSSLEERPTVTSQKKDRPASMPNEGRSQLSVSMNKSMDSRTMQHWDKSGLRCQALCGGSWQRGTRLELHAVVGIKAKENMHGRNRPSGNAWLSALLTDLPDWALRDPRVGRVLEKLARFDDGSSLHVWPQVFLGVLEMLPPWELCCPDLCVAIEIVREHVVHMKREDYDAWLESQVILPRRSQSAPHKK